MPRPRLTSHVCKINDVHCGEFWLFLRHHRETRCVFFAAPRAPAAAATIGWATGPRGGSVTWPANSEGGGKAPKETDICVERKMASEGAKTVSFMSARASWIMYVPQFFISFLKASGSAINQEHVFDIQNETVTYGLFIRAGCGNQRNPLSGLADPGPFSSPGIREQPLRDSWRFLFVVESGGCGAGGGSCLGPGYLKMWRKNYNFRWMICNTRL